VDFDGKWIYDRCKEMDGMPNMAGTYFRMGLKILKDKGAKPLLMNESEAGQYKIGAYASVDDMSFEGLKKAIRQNSVLLAGFRGSNAGWQSAYVRPPKTGEEVWGHAVALIGFNKDYLIF
jgi:2-keto-3-deoxy-galactonokinase